ncbi:MAG: glycosyltransferase family 39 protein [Anaerolineales bacterium]
MPEPSVLDYVKALLSFGRRLPVIPSLPRQGRKPTRVERSLAAKPARRAAFSMDQLPWRSGLAVLLFLAAQGFWLSPRTNWQWGLLLALVAAGLTGWAAQRGEWRLPKLEPIRISRKSLAFSYLPLGLGLVCFALTFVFTGENRFNNLNITLWLLSIGFVLVAFWQLPQSPQTAWKNFMTGTQQRAWAVQISHWTLALLAAFAVIAFFRFSQLETMPAEMLSDHAEKLLDVNDVFQGQPAIFFERNTGREPLQFYLTAGVIQLFDTGISFLSLKIGTVFLAFVSLIYVFLLGKEFGGRWVGLFALLLVGVAFWPNLLARTGLRFSLFTTFAAPSLYYLLHGLRRGHLNDFLLSGVFIGLGLNGYSAFRIVPLVAGAAVALFLLHTPNAELRRRGLIGFALLTLVTLVICTPLVRYAIENPAAFSERMSTRLFETERPYPAPPALTFVSNVLHGLGMFNVSGGQIWLVGISDNPAFDPVSAALLLLGALLAVLRYARNRSWLDLFLLISIPLLMLPSTLSLAFPEENPAMNRASGAMLPAFILCALGLDAFLHGLRDKLGDKFGLRVAQLSGALLLVLIASSNYSLFFNKYISDYDASSWNTSELGEVIADYAGSFGSYDSAWVVAYAHWVDTRLVGINAGNPSRDYGIWPDQLSSTLSTPAPKLFILKPNDDLGLATLKDYYPEGLLSTRSSRVPGKEFMIYFVPEQP